MALGAGIRLISFSKLDLVRRIFDELAHATRTCNIAQSQREKNGIVFFGGRCHIGNNVFFALEVRCRVEFRQVSDADFLSHGMRLYEVWMSKILALERGWRESEAQGYCA